MDPTQTQPNLPVEADNSVNEPLKNFKGNEAYVVPVVAEADHSWTPEEEPKNMPRFSQHSDGYRILDLVPAKYPEIEGGFVLAGEEARGELRFECPFGGLGLTWRGCNDVVEEPELKLPLSNTTLHRGQDPKCFIYQPLVYLRADQKTDERFVFIGPFQNVPQECFILFEDLRKRLVTGMIDHYKEDYKLYLQGNYNHFPVWDRNGSRKQYIRFLPSIYDSVENWQKLYTDKFNSLYLVRIFKNFCNIAQAASTKVSEWDCVLARGWDDSLNFSKIPIIVVNGTRCKDIMKEALKEIKDRKYKFNPAIDVVIDRITESIPEGFKEFSYHPATFYSLFLSETDEKLLGTAVRNKDGDLRSFQKVGTILEKFDNLPIIPVDKTYSWVTEKTKEAASATPRWRSQNVAMNNTSAPAIAQYLWDLSNGLFIGEWLHRSAYSFGGLKHVRIRGAKGPDNAQTPENLVFGTYEANTSMIRYEEHIKRAAKYSEGVDVETKLISEWEGPKTSWLAQKLEYSGSYKIGTPGPPEKAATVFDLFSTRRPTRFELKLDEIFDHLYFQAATEKKTEKTTIEIEEQKE